MLGLSGLAGLLAEEIRSVPFHEQKHNRSVPFQKNNRSNPFRSVLKSVPFQNIRSVQQKNVEIRSVSLDSL